MISLKFPRIILSLYVSQNFSYRFEPQNLVLMPCTAYKNNFFKKENFIEVKFFCIYSL